MQRMMAQRNRTQPLMILPDSNLNEEDNGEEGDEHQDTTDDDLGVYGTGPIFSRIPEQVTSYVL